MTRRRVKRKRQRMESAKSDDEVPGPLAALAVAHPIIAGLTAAGAGAGVALGAKKFMKGPSAPQQQSVLSPVKAGNDTELKPGQKTNAIYTSPQGVLTDPSTARSTLLGGVK